MARLNLTLDKDTSDWIQRHASRAKMRRAAFARKLLHEAVLHREEIARRRRLAADYASDREGAADLLRDLQDAQFEVLDDET